MEPAAFFHCDGINNDYVCFAVTGDLRNMFIATACVGTLINVWSIVQPYSWYMFLLEFLVILCRKFDYTCFKLLFLSLFGSFRISTKQTMCLCFVWTDRRPIDFYHQVEDECWVHSDGFEQQLAVTVFGFISEAVQLLTLTPVCRQQLWLLLSATWWLDEG